MNLCHRLFCLSLFGAICGLAQAAAPRHSLALPPVSVPPVGEFVVPSEMPAQAEITRLPAELIVQFQTEVLAKASSKDARLERLVAFMFESWGMGMTYDGSTTRTVSQAYLDRKGNCLSFTLTFLELARLAGLNAEMQESEQALVSMADSDRVIFTGHVNANVLINRRSAEVHFDPNRPLLRSVRETISRQRALAHYYNNRGAELMEEGAYSQADAHLAEALNLDPSLVAAYNNRGVLKLRQQDVSAAERLFMSAYQLDPDGISVLSNLVSLYRLQADSTQLDLFENRLAKAQSRNPYHHFLMGLQDERKGDHESALMHFTLAARLDRRVPLYRWALSRVLQATGDLEQARTQARRAVALERTSHRPVREVRRCCSRTMSYSR
ncbi:MAG: hypothetical protein KDI37_14695 [Xanthomonadales bacterium]|nr:hypothetical protein [Xanthomonadales bacterium]